MFKADGGKRALVLETRAIRKDRRGRDGVTTCMCVCVCVCIGETVQKRARVVRFA